MTTEEPVIEGNQVPPNNPSSLFNFFHEKPFLNSFLLTFLLVTLSLVFFKPYFIYNDDYIMLLLLKGVGLTTAPSELVQLENVLFTSVLKTLYTHFPGFQWYSAFHVLSLFLSFWAILASLMMRPNRLFKSILFTLSSFALIFYFFSLLQWTYTASLAAMGAVFLLASRWSNDHSRHRYKVFTLAFILILFSVFVRFSVFSLILLTSLPWFIFMVWKKEITPVCLSIIRFLGATALVILVAVGYNHYVYQRDPAWVDFMRLESLRTQLTDFQNPVYDAKTKPLFDSIGWTYDDFFLFTDFCYMDKDLYSQEKFRKLIDYFPRFAFNKHYDSSFSAVFSYQTVQLAAAFFLVLLFFLPIKELRLAVVNVIWVFVVFLFLMLYLKIPERLCFPLVLFVMYVNLFGAVAESQTESLERSASRWGFKAGAALLVPLLVFSLYFTWNVYRVNSQNIINANVVKTSLKDLNPRDDQLFVNCLSSINFESIPAFYDFEMFRHFNIIQLSWNQRSPTTEAMLKRFKVVNLFRDMVDNPNVFLVIYSEMAGKNIMGFLLACQNYLKGKYGMEVSFEQAFKYPTFWVMRIHSVGGKRID